jgi:hypothetical protein
MKKTKMRVRFENDMVSHAYDKIYVGDIIQGADLAPWMAAGDFREQLATRAYGEGYYFVKLPHVETFESYGFDIELVEVDEDEE